MKAEIVELSSQLLWPKKKKYNALLRTVSTSFYEKAVQDS